MIIKTIESYLLELPLARPIVAAITSGDRGAACNTILMPVVRIATDDGLIGEGFAWAIGAGGKTLLTAIREDLGPILIGENPLDNERLWETLYWKTQAVGRVGVIPQAISALDLALWDIKGKVCGQPVFKLLGGMRDSAPVYGSDGGWLNMSVSEILSASEVYLNQGMRGIKIKVGHEDPGIDLQRIDEIRRALGDDVWIAVDANQKWDFATALKMGREFEQLGCAWYEEPMTCEDVHGHARLAEKLDIPIALGETLGSLHEINAYLRADAVDIVQPDITRVGGLTPFLKIASICHAAHRPVEPHLMMEASVHLACGLPAVVGLEYMPWLTRAFAEPPVVENGHLSAPTTPGLGLNITPETIEQYRLA